MKEQFRWYTVSQDWLDLFIYVQAGAKKTSIQGLHGESLKVVVQAQPIDGKANEAVRVCLASFLEVSKSSIFLVKGTKSRYKQFRIPKNQVNSEVLAKLELIL